MSRNFSQVKSNLFDHCLNQVNDRIRTIQEAIDAAQQAANNETKSSAGDKYETTRAMMHLEKEKSTHQLAAAITDKQALSQINVRPTYETVHPGCLVSTNKGLFFLAISAGKIKLANSTYFAISPSSPIGKLLFGKGIGDSVDFKGNRFEILDIG